MGSRIIRRGKGCASGSFLAALARSGGAAGVPSLRHRAPGSMSFWLDALCREDPVALVHSCHQGLSRLLRCHRGKPIRRFWIDHPYGEEEITLLEEELIPAMEQFLARIQEIDSALEASHEVEVERVQAAMAAELVAQG
ncbi:hypothetical protein [Cyanobium sp. ULC084]